MDIAHFKEALGHYATGVVVVSAMTDEGPVGFTCQTFGSLSLEPTLISFAARSASNTWPKIHENEVVGVSILASDQEAVARCFATTGVDKFDGVSFHPGPLGSPLLNNALAHLEGRIVSVTTHGDHDIAVVHVEHVEVHEGMPLLYYRGGFNVLV
jgi:3-hydroxy-9,10-secoandrosta-1,3,5(10)-triene-9,17-dione monooxygenase reductase component